MTKIQEMQTKMEKLKADMKAEANSIFKPLALELFEKYPELVRFSWTQYTPYFNDGDTCEFRANNEYPGIVLQAGLEEFEQSDWHDEETFAGNTPEMRVKEIEKAVKDFTSQFNEELLEDMFGNHVEVIVTRDGVETEEYDHD